MGKLGVGGGPASRGFADENQRRLKHLLRSETCGRNMPIICQAWARPCDSRWTGGLPTCREVAF